MTQILLRIARKLLLNEQQLEWACKYAPFGIAAAYVLYLELRFLPGDSWFGLLTLTCLFLFGLNALGLSDWESRPGIWIRAMLILASIVPIYFALTIWETSSFIRSVWPQGGRVAIRWEHIGVAVDLALGLSLMEYHVRFSVTVLIENLRRTGDVLMRVW